MSPNSLSIWYPRYVGDYQRKTSHLSLIEHGAYSILLDHYYSTGKPLPANVEHLHRICRAFADDERDAVASVLSQFFALQPDGYHNSKADEELIRRSEISKKRQLAAVGKTSNCSANAQHLPVQMPTQSQSQSHSENKILEGVSKGLTGKRPLPANERKAIWQSKICREAELTMPAAEYQSWLVAFAEDDPRAKAVAEQIDRKLKANGARHA